MRPRTAPAPDGGGAAALAPPARPPTRRMQVPQTGTDRPLRRRFRVLRGALGDRSGRRSARNEFPPMRVATAGSGRKAFVCCASGTTRSSTTSTAFCKRSPTPWPSSPLTPTLSRKGEGEPRRRPRIPLPRRERAASEASRVRVESAVIARAFGEIRLRAFPIPKSAEVEWSDAHHHHRTRAASEWDASKKVEFASASFHHTHYTASAPRVLNMESTRRLPAPTSFANTLNCSRHRYWTSISGTSNNDLSLPKSPRTGFLPVSHRKRPHPLLV